MNAVTGVDGASLNSIPMVVIRGDKFSLGVFGN